MSVIGVNKSLELQKIVIQSIKNIDVFKQKNIAIYSSIPSRAVLPYIKLASLALNNNPTGEIKTFTIDLFVATKGKNNKDLLEIMETLFNNLNLSINNYLALNEDITCQIYNIYNLKYSIQEDLQNNIWNGHFYFDVDLI